MVSSEIQTYLFEIGVLSFIVPVVILFIWRFQSKKNMLPALAGLIVYLLFAKLLEVIPNNLFINFDTPVSQAILSNPLLYVIYLGILAAIFEETGRYLAFRFYLNKRDERETAITYGIGHGAAEVFYILGLTSFSRLSTTYLVEANGKDIISKSMLEELSSLTKSSLIIEAVGAVLFFALQICLSIIMLQAFRNKAARIRLILMAMGLHFVMYFPYALVKYGQVIQNILPQIIYLVLLFLILMISLIFIIPIYKKMEENDEERSKDVTQKKQETKKKNFSYARKKLSSIEENKESNQK